MYLSGLAKVDNSIDTVAPITLPVAVGIGGVGAELAVDEGGLSPTRVDGLIVAVLGVEGYFGAHAEVAQQVLFADDTLAILII